MLTLENTALFIVDVQGKLAQLMYEKEKLFKNLQIIIKGAKILGLPIVWVEQNPDGLGPTIPEVAELLTNIQPIAKLSFSACGCKEFIKEFKSLNRNQILIAGIETHICVYQSSVDLLDLDYEVHVVTDAVSSRTPENRQVGLDKIKDAGGFLTSTETAIFELLKVAEGQKFKEILKIVK